MEYKLGKDGWPTDEVVLSLRDEKIYKLEQQLASSQAREKVRIEALIEIRRICVETRIAWLASEALRLPTDDTALKAALAAEREADRRKIIDIVRFELDGNGQAEAICLAIRALGD